MYHKMEAEQKNFNSLFWTLKDNKNYFLAHTNIVPQNNPILFALNNGRGLEGRLFIIGQRHSDGPPFGNLFNEDKFNSIDEKRLITPLKMLLDSSKLVKNQILDALKVLRPTIHKSIIQISLGISTLKNNAVNNPYLIEQENRLNDYFFSILEQQRRESEEPRQQYSMKSLY